MVIMNNSFEQLGIVTPILRALTEMGFENPTSVQEEAIPHILDEKDLLVMSKTGSGKTAVYGVSMLQMIDPNKPGPQGLVLVPTRELAVQVENDLKLMAKYTSHKTTSVYGQHNISMEVKALNAGPSIVSGTPGRVFDHINQGNLITENIRFLVLDEADRMLDMGFIDQVVRIVKQIPKNRITLLFSATIPYEIKDICSKYMKNPLTIEIESPTMTVDTIKQLYYRVKHNQKRTWLNDLLLKEQPQSCLIFCNTRMTVDRVHHFLLNKGYASQALHGNIPQGRRLKTMGQFKHGKVQILVATDVAARGIHVDDLSLVINYDVPVEKDSYVHRIGRTGRAGNAGKAISLATSEDIMSLYEIEEHIGVMIEEKDLPPESEVRQYAANAEEWIKSHSHNMPLKNNMPRGSHRKSSDRNKQASRTNSRSFKPRSAPSKKDKAPINDEPLRNKSNSKVESNTSNSKAKSNEFKTKVKSNTSSAKRGKGPRNRKITTSIMIGASTKPHKSNMADETTPKSAYSSTKGSVKPNKENSKFKKLFNRILG